MKVYKPKKVLTYLRILLLVGIVLFLNNNTLSYAKIHKVYNNNLNKTVEISVIQKAQDEIYLEELLTVKSSFTGNLTGYAGDCPKCSGILGCRPRTNVLEEGILFDDTQYGTVRIVASSKKYPCGTIIRFTINKLSNEPIIAIIMDRGVRGDAIDLLTESEEYARNNIGRVKNQKFDILRLGWNNAR